MKNIKSRLLETGRRFYFTEILCLGGGAGRFRAFFPIRTAPTVVADGVQTALIAAHRRVALLIWVCLLRTAQLTGSIMSIDNPKRTKY